MEDTFLLSDGLIVTLVAMVVVFLILASIWGLMEFVHKILPKKIVFQPHKVVSERKIKTNFTKDEKRERIAVLAALIQSHQDHPAKKYEIFEVKRLK